MTGLPSFTGFRPAAFTFFRGLARQNTKPWFEAHRDMYETEVKAPLQLLVEEVDARLGEVAPEMVGHPKRSVFRIHRDIRFSKDKSPYKTHAACWFFHRDAGHGVGATAAHAGAGFYFHLEPKGSMLGGGIWMPPGPALKLIREALVKDYRTFERIVQAPTFKRRFGTLSDEMRLTRPPRGFTPEHPAAEWLRYKSFTVGRDLTPEVVMRASLPDLLVKEYVVMLPMIRWLNAAVGLRAATVR